MSPTTINDLVIRRADPSDADAIAAAHADSIRSLGAAYYSEADAAAWQDGLSGSLYVQAMKAGEVFFIATGVVDGTPLVLGFASDYPVEGTTHGTSVYVRGVAARQGIGGALLRRAEACAVERGATAIQIDASLAGVAFYESCGYHEVRRGAAHLISGRPLACVVMRKQF
jgi:GNAT superfamily N-acetyltransferase